MFPFPIIQGIEKGRRWYVSLVFRKEVTHVLFIYHRKQTVITLPGNYELKG